MKKIALPNGLTVSEIALGAMMFGSTTSKEDSYRVLDTYIAQLQDYRTALENQNMDALIALFEEGRRCKEEVDG